MVQWGWTCSDTWAEDAASSTVTCSLGQNGGQRDGGGPRRPAGWVRDKSQVSPDGARREAGLLELHTEGHVTLGQDGCCLRCPLLIPTLDGAGQEPCQLLCREGENHHSRARLLPPTPSGHLPVPFSIKSPGLQGTSSLGWGALDVGTSGGLGGETRHNSGPRAGSKLSLPRRQDVGVGWCSPEIVPQPSTHLGLCCLTSGVRVFASSQPMPGPCLGHTSSKASPEPWPLQTPQGPDHPSGLGLHVGSGVLESAGDLHPLSWLCPWPRHLGLLCSKQTLSGPGLGALLSPFPPT